MFVTYMYVLYTTNILIYTLCPMFLSFIRIIIMYYYYFNLHITFIMFFQILYKYYYYAFCIITYIYIYSTPYTNLL